MIYYRDDRPNFFYMETFKLGLRRLPEPVKALLRVLIITPTRFYIRNIPWNFGKKLLWRLIASHVWWLETKVIAKTRSGDKLLVDANDIVGKYISYFGSWEPCLTEWLKSTLKPGDIFIDVGANVGYFSLLAARLVGATGKVLAIEALPSTAEVLRGNVSINKVSNTRIENVAAWDEHTEIQLYTHQNHIAGTTTSDQRWANSWGLASSCIVQAKPLTEIATDDEMRMVRVIKIDVEGAEWKIACSLASATGILRDEVEIVMEVNFQVLKEMGQSGDEMLRVFREHGFNAYSLENDYTVDAYLSRRLCPRPKRLRSCDEAEGVQMDVIFSKRDVDEL
jgi:FkbM family methyltransferase